MSDRSDEILATLKNIEAWYNLQRKITKWALWSPVPLVLIMIAILFGADRYLDQTIKSHSEATWLRSVEELQKSGGDFPPAQVSIRRESAGTRNP